MDDQTIEYTENDLHDIVGKHVKWKIRFGNAINHKIRFNLDIIRRDDCCEVGKWLHSKGRKYAEFPAYKTLVARHAEFHRQAAEVAFEANLNNYKVVQRMLAPGSPYNTAFSEIDRAVRNLIREAGL